MAFGVVKLVTPLQAGIAVAIVMALSARHMGQYNKHVERYGPLAEILIERRIYNNFKGTDADEISQKLGNQSGVLQK